MFYDIGHGVFTFNPTFELELEKTKLERAKEEHAVVRLKAKLSGRDSNGDTPQGCYSPNQRPKDYFKELQEHFNANNDTNRFAITRTKFLCQVWDGKTVVHTETFEPNEGYDLGVVETRNLYLMFYDSNYNVESFLHKRDEGEFRNFDGFNPKRNTPKKLSHRSNVYQYIVVRK
jgi:hypothetical protein